MKYIYSEIYDVSHCLSLRYDMIGEIACWLTQYADSLIECRVNATFSYGKEYATRKLLLSEIIGRKSKLIPFRPKSPIVAHRVIATSDALETLVSFQTVKLTLVRRTLSRVLLVHSSASSTRRTGEHNTGHVYRCVIRHSPRVIRVFCRYWDT